MSQLQENGTEFGDTAVPQRKKVIHFANGDTMEMDSSDGDGDAPQKEPFSAPENTAQISWRAYSWCLCLKAGRKSLQTCDFIGAKLANLMGLNMAKYQYAIDQFHRDQTEGRKCRGTDGAPCVEGGAEMIQLSPETGAQYGATKSLRLPGLEASPYSAEHDSRATGSHNKGYQDD
ncbi:hypothetical protein GJAV_G00121980 [Gymnothorax javanicus]|nr:hypothetical protein GJAV_G00121980 [Gymnothorax javanicus]